MTHLRQDFGNRVLVLGLLALTVGLIHALPDLWFRHDMGDRYAFSMVNAMLDEEAYFARIRDVYDGHLWPGHAFLAEHKNDAWAVPTLVEMLVGLGGRTLGLSISNLGMTLDAGCAAAIFVLGYLVLRREFQLGFGWAVVGALATVTASTELARPPEIVLAVLDRLGATHGALWKTDTFWIDRSTAPQVHYVLALLYLLTLGKSRSTPPGGWAILAGLILGLFAYTSPFFLLFLSLGTVIQALWPLGEWRRNGRLVALVGVTATVVALPFVFHYGKLVHEPLFAAVAERMDAVGRQVLFSKRDLVMVLVFPLLVRRWDRSAWYVYSFILGGILCTNIQLITGRSVAVWHWMLYTNAYWAVLAGAWLGERWVGGRPKRSYLLLTVACVALIANGLFVQVRHYREPQRPPHSARYGWQDWKGFQELAPTLRWLEARTRTDDVVLSGDTSSVILSMFSSNNVYMHYWGQSGLVSADELLSRMFLTFKVFNVPPDRFAGVLQRPTWGTRRLEVWVPLERTRGRDTPEKLQESIREISIAYASFWSNPLDEQLCRYRLDYVLFSFLEGREFAHEGERFHPEVVSRLEPAYQDPRATVFKVMGCGAGK